MRTCPNCAAPVVGHPNKKFCSGRCKDDYHNRVNPRGINAHLEPRPPRKDVVLDRVEERTDFVRFDPWDDY